MADVSELLLRVKGAEKAKSDIKKVDKSLQDVQKSAEDIFISAVSSWGFKQLTEFTLKFGEIWKDTAITLNSYRAVFGSLNKEALEGVEILKNNFDETEKSAKKIAVAFSTMFTDLNMSKAELGQLFKSVAPLIANIAATYGEDATQVAKKVAKGLRGEVDGLKDFGIVINKESAKIKNQINDLKSMGFDEVLATVKALSGEVVNQGTKFKDNFSEISFSFSQQVGNIMNTLNSGLFPLIGRILGLLAPMLQLIDKLLGNKLVQAIVAISTSIILLSTSIALLKGAMIGLPKLWAFTSGHYDSYFAWVITKFNELKKVAVLFGVKSLDVLFKGLEKLFSFVPYLFNLAGRTIGILGRTLAILLENRSMFLAVNKALATGFAKAILALSNGIQNLAQLAISVSASYLKAIGGMFQASKLELTAAKFLQPVYYKVAHWLDALSHGLWKISDFISKKAASIVILQNKALMSTKWLAVEKAVLTPFLKLFKFYEMVFARISKFFAGKYGLAIYLGALIAGGIISIVNRSLGDVKAKLAAKGWSTLDQSGAISAIILYKLSILSKDVVSAIQNWMNGESFESDRSISKKYASELRDSLNREKFTMNEIKESVDDWLAATKAYFGLIKPHDLESLNKAKEDLRKLYKEKVDAVNVAGFIIGPAREQAELLEEHAKRAMQEFRFEDAKVYFKEAMANANMAEEGRVEWERAINTAKKTFEKYKQVADEVNRIERKIAENKFETSSFFNDLNSGLMNAFQQIDVKGLLKNVDEKIKILNEKFTDGKNFKSIFNMDDIRTYYKDIANLEMEKFNIEKDHLQKEAEMIKANRDIIKSAIDKMLEFKEAGISGINANEAEGYKYMTSSIGKISSLKPILDQQQMDEKTYKTKTLTLAEKTKKVLDSIHATLKSMDSKETSSVTVVY